MASDNEDDDLAALREAALATLKQKVQPIENVFSGNNLTRPQEPAAWSDIPASIDFPAFSDPIPEQNHFPTPYGEPGSQPPQPPQHHFRPASNLPWHPSHQNRMPPFHSQRMRHPRFPHGTFGAMHDRGNKRIRQRDYLPPDNRRGGHPPINYPYSRNIMLPPQMPPGVMPSMGANLIVIQPHMHSKVENVPSSITPAANSIPRSSQPDSATAPSRPKLVLPQDKYHSSDNPTTTQAKDIEAEPKAKSKDKFSRYDKSDSEEEDDDDDLSEVDDIANEIDKVLQDDFLAEEIKVEEAEETTDEKKDVSEEEEKKEEPEESPAESPVSSERQETDKEDTAPETPAAPAVMSDISDSESLDLDALAGGEPVIGDLEDLDSLVDKEPDMGMDAGDTKSPVIDGTRRKGSTNSIDSDRNSDFRDKCVDSSKKDSDIRRKSPLYRRSPVSPNNNYHKSSSPPARYKNSASPQRKYGSYNDRARLSPRRSRSPVYSKHSTYRRSISPRSTTFRPRSRSPLRRRSPLRGSSISPRRRLGSPSQRRYDTSPRRYRPMDRARRRSLSPIGRARSPPRDSYRPGREDGNRVRDNYGGRQGEQRYRDFDRSRRDRDRPRPDERDRSENQRQPNANVKVAENKEASPVRKRISPLMEKNTTSQEKEQVNIDLEKLNPEERSKIEARRKKFDSRAEVNVAEASKKISLKDIKKRDKKAKKREDEKREEEVESLKVDEKLPDVENKKSSKSSGISLKKLRKKQESKKKRDEEEVVEEDSPKAVGIADLEEESEEDSDEGRSWRKEGAGASGREIKFGVSRTMVKKAPLVSLDRIGPVGGRRGHDSNRRRFPEHHERRGHAERLRVNKSHSRMQNKRWSSDEDSDNGGIQASRLGSSVVTSKPFEADVPPEKLRIQVQIAPKDSKKKSKALPDFSNVYSVHAKRRRGADTVIDEQDDQEVAVEEVVVPTKKAKKKKEKKKKHSKDESPKVSNSIELFDDDNDQGSMSKSPAKPSVLERLGKKVSLDSLEKKEKKKKKSKKNRDIDEDTDDLDLHILKMKAKNEEILRRQREIQLDKERYG